MRYLYMFLAIFLLSCNDEGNYDYHKINEITIDGITDQELYEVISLKDKLIIRPDITGFLSGKDITGLEFEWKLFLLKSNNVVEGADYVIGREKDLEYRVTENAGTYYGSYTVIDKKNDLKFQKRFFVSVKSATSEGWAILCEENNKSRLDWIFNVSETKDEILKDLWVDENYDMGKPVSLNFFYGLEGSYRLVNAEKGSFNLDPILQMAGESRNMKYLFFTLPDRIDIRGGSPQITYRAPSVFVVVDNKGDIYTRTLDPGAMFDYRSNIIPGESNYFVAAPYVAMYIIKGSGGGGGGSIILYDQTNCRFVEYLTESTYPSVAKFVGTKFKSTDNHEMVFMETTQGQQSYAVLRNKITGKYYVYGFKIDKLGINNQTHYSEVKGPDLDKLTKISFHSIYNYMFYSTDSKVYRFEVQNDPANIVEAEEVISLPGETIVEIMSYKYSAWKIFVPWETDRASRFVVASNKNGQTTDCGNVRIYDVPSLSKPLKLYRDYLDKGIGKIVDINYFEPGK